MQRTGVEPLLYANQAKNPWIRPGLLKRWVATHLGWRNVIWGRETNWLDKPDMKVFVNIDKIHSRPAVNLFLLHFSRQFRVLCCQLYTRMSAWAIEW